MQANSVASARGFVLQPAWLRLQTASAFEAEMHKIVARAAELV